MFRSVLKTSGEHKDVDNHVTSLNLDDAQQMMHVWNKNRYLVHIEDGEGKDPAREDQSNVDVVVVMETSDGIVECSRKLAINGSHLIQEMLEDEVAEAADEDEDDEATTVIPLRNLSTRILQLIVQFWQVQLDVQYKSPEWKPLTEGKNWVTPALYEEFITDVEKEDILIELLIGADFLDIPMLIDLICGRIVAESSSAADRSYSCDKTAENAANEEESLMVSMICNILYDKWTEIVPHGVRESIRTEREYQISHLWDRFSSQSILTAAEFFSMHGFPTEVESKYALREAIYVKQKDQLRAALIDSGLGWMTSYEHAIDLMLLSSTSPLVVVEPREDSTSSWTFPISSPRRSTMVTNILGKWIRDLMAHLSCLQPDYVQDTLWLFEKYEDSIHPNPHIVQFILAFNQRLYPSVISSEAYVAEQLFDPSSIIYGADHRFIRLPPRYFARLLRKDGDLHLRHRLCLIFQQLRGQQQPKHAPLPSALPSSCYALQCLNVMNLIPIEHDHNYRQFWDEDGDGMDYYSTWSLSYPNITTTIAVDDYESEGELMVTGGDGVDW